MKNIVVIGCGAVLERCHRWSLEQAPKRLGLAVAGLVDSNPARLAQAKKWFPGAEVFENSEACFQKLQGTLLTIITSPPPLHAAHADAAFSQGTHVLCEKPLAGSLADAEHIVAAAKQSGKVLSLGMTRRFFPCLAEARRRILDSALGGNLTFTYREGEVYLWPIASAAPFYRETSGGGVLLDKGVHVLDFLSFLFGGGKVVSCRDDGPVGSVEANAIAELQFEMATGTMQLSWDTNLANGLHIRGSKGELWIPAGGVDLIFSRENARAAWRQERIRVEWPLDLEPKGDRRGCPTDYNECFLFQLAQTLRAIQLGESPAASGEDGVATLRLISAAYQAAVPLDKPWLSSAEQAWCRARHWRIAPV